MKEAHKERLLWGMVIDLDKCTGCGACSVACQAENNVTGKAQAGWGVWHPKDDETNKLRSVSWLKVYRLHNHKPFPDYREAYLPRPCMHCDHHPPCVSVCPPTATTKDEEGGIVSQIYTRCIGCRYCVAACPYHVRYFNWFDPYFPAGTKRYLNPDVSVRMRGVVEKCHFCHHRWMLAKQKAAYLGQDMSQVTYTPACAEICPTGAIYFGNLLDPDSDVARLSQSEYAFRLLERLGTEPKVYYLSTQRWVRDWSDNQLADEIADGTGA